MVGRYRALAEVNAAVAPRHTFARVPVVTGIERDRGFLIKLAPKPCDIVTGTFHVTSQEEVRDISECHA